jgi:hypothetical protein
MKSMSAVARIVPAERQAATPAAQNRGRREQALNSIKACLDQLRAEATGHRAELAALLIGAAAEACLDALGEEKPAEPK